MPSSHNRHTYASLLIDLGSLRNTSKLKWALIHQRHDGHYDTL